MQGIAMLRCQFELAVMHCFPQTNMEPCLMALEGFYRVTTRAYRILGYTVSQTFMQPNVNISKQLGGLDRTRFGIPRKFGEGKWCTKRSLPHKFAAGLPNSKKQLLFHDLRAKSRR